MNSPKLSGTSPSVVIAGGGPIGMWLAADLGARGVRTLVIERNTEGSNQAKVMQISIRTLEYARQLGFADQMSNWGFPHDYPMNNVFATSLDGYELGRSDGAPIGQPGAPGYTEFSPQFQVHCPQPWLEPIVEKAARSHGCVDVRRGWEFDSFDETEQGVTVYVTDLATGDHEVVHADYLIGCEGFGGKVGAQVGIPVEERTVDYSVDLEFTTDDLFAEHDKGKATRYTLIGPEGTWATLVAVDGQFRWRLSIYGVERDLADELDADAAVLRAVGHPFDYTIIRRGRWKRRAAMAATFVRGRVILAGDAAHCSPPNGGFGMNTGIADVMNLGWKLQAAVEGWAGDDLLESYGAERRPIAQMTLAESIRDYGRLVNESSYPEIEGTSPEAIEQRRIIGERLANESLKAWRPLGVHLGYGYPWSSIVNTKPGEYPQFEMQDYVPSNDAGFRAPHVWLEPNRSTLDLFGPTHVLLRVGQGGPTGQGLIEAASDARMPIAVHEISGEAVEAVYDKKLLLVRPDGYIAWSGDQDPKDPERIITTARGAIGVRVLESESIGSR